jgi:YidC/Oxa1 family membrane protein insertase
MIMNKQVIIAAVLIGALWIGYFTYMSNQAEKNPPKKDVAPATEQQTPQAKKTDTIEKAAKSTILSVPSRANKQEDTLIRTKYYQAILSNKGARIESVKYGARSIELAGIPIEGGKGLLDFGLQFSDKEILTGNELSETLWTMKKISDTKVQFETMAKISGEPVIIQKTYTFNGDSPSFELGYVIKNSGRKQLAFPDGRIIVSPADSLGPKTGSNGGSTYDMLYSVYYSDSSFKKGDRGGGFFSTETEMKNHAQKTNWYGIINRYFAVVMIPQDGTCSGVAWDSRKTGSYRIGGYIPVEPLAPGASVERRFKVALAEKEKDILATVDPGIVSANDVSGFIEPLRNGIFWCLVHINMLFGNLGVSIVILSIITKTIFLPLTIKSTNAMKRMSQLQPKVAEIKAKYKDKPQKLQQEMMELYKVHKVNPMSGCLPLLIQMPFFIALYSALSTSLDLWQAPFTLWIKDLSSQDAVWMIPGIGYSLNILPILMTASTFIQQKMSSVDTGASGGQAMMMKMMPILFIFFFWTMPSGLTLYWTIQNILQIGHQLYVNKYKKTVPVEE